MSAQDCAAQSCRARFSKIAGASIILASPPAVATIALAIVAIRLFTTPKQGWEGLGRLLAVTVVGQVVVIGGTVCAALAIALGAAAMGRIRRRPRELGGYRTARAAVAIGSTFLVLAWGAIATSIASIAIHTLRRAPYLGTQADMRAAFGAAKQFAQRNGLFPAELAQVVSPEVADRYVYCGENLPTKYADYRTPGSQSIVVMYAKNDIGGEYIAICANGMTHKWTKSVLDGALRASEAERAARGVPNRKSEGVMPDRVEPR